MNARAYVLSFFEARGAAYFIEDLSTLLAALKRTGGDVPAGNVGEIIRALGREGILVEKAGEWSLVRKKVEQGSLF